MPCPKKLYANFDADKLIHVAVVRISSEEPRCSHRLAYVEGYAGASGRGASTALISLSPLFKFSSFVYFWKYY